MVIIHALAGTVRGTVRVRSVSPVAKTTVRLPRGMEYHPGYDQNQVVQTTQIVRLVTLDLSESN